MANDTEFEPVWCQWDQPRAAHDARSNTLTGRLCVSGSKVEFQTDTAVSLHPVLGVSRGPRGSDFMNRWIEMHYGSAEDPTTVYLNDGGWRGWRPLLTGSNRRMTAALRAAVA